MNVHQNLFDDSLVEYNKDEESTFDINFDQKLFEPYKCTLALEKIMQAE